jgi:hypothetical protein
MIVEEALRLAPKHVLITTYTTENLAQIREYFIERCGCLPSHVTLISLFGFFLQDGIKPYQCSVIEPGRIKSINFENLPHSARFVQKANSEAYYLTRDRDVFKDRVSDLAFACDDASKGLVIKRLERIYDHIFIDELQDLAGPDLDFLGKLFRSRINIVCVGDPRQGTFMTNKSAKNKRFRRSGILEWIRIQQDSGLVVLEERNECYRCNQTICDFADRLFPGFPKTVSMNKNKTDHDGIFQIKAEEVGEYIKKRNPVVLRWSKKTDTLGFPAINFGYRREGPSIAY